jgi:hypothetical protein
MNLDDINELRVYNSGAIINQLEFTNMEKILFGGIMDPSKSAGSTRCYHYPMSTRISEGKNGIEPKDPKTYAGHDKRGIVAMAVTHNDKYLITAGNDGCIILYLIKDKEALG